MYFANIICWPQANHRRLWWMPDGKCIFFTYHTIDSDSKQKNIISCQKWLPSWHFWGMKSEAKTETDT